MLFNVVTDPGERHDLSRDRPDLVDVLRRRMEELKKTIVPNQSSENVDLTSSIRNGVLYPEWC